MARAASVASAVARTEAAPATIREFSVARWMSAFTATFWYHSRLKCDQIVAEELPLKEKRTSSRIGA